MVLQFALFSMFAASASILVSGEVGKVLVSLFVRWLRLVLHTPFLVISNLPPPIRLAIELPLVAVFFVWFQLMMAFERLVLRQLLHIAGGVRHPSGRQISTVNSIDPHFTPSNRFNLGTVDFDLETAVSLMNLSKLAYEDRALIADELARAGFDMQYFKVIKYYNTSAFVCVRDGVVIISFRGSEPLNLMHFITDFNGDLVDVATLDGNWFDGGKIHYGFLEALRLHRTDRPADGEDVLPGAVRRGSLATLRLDPNDVIGSSVQTVVTLWDFVYRSFKIAASSPITMRSSSRRRKLTAFQQITDQLDFIDQNVEIKRIYTTGHSLGGALALTFLSQAICSDVGKRLCDMMHVYMFAGPRVGDPRFSEWMRENGCAKRIWKVVNAQDVVPRMPVLPDQAPAKLMPLPGPYAEAPGTTVHLHPTRPQDKVKRELSRKRKSVVLTLTSDEEVNHPPRRRSVAFAPQPTYHVFRDPFAPNGTIATHKHNKPDAPASQPRRSSLFAGDVYEQSAGLSFRKDGSLPAVEMWSFSGILSRDGISHIRQGRRGLLWLVLRLCMPFFVFDHIPAEYARVLEQEWEDAKRLASEARD
ncbi:hypothetical protein PYCC9005_005346 [Savitreella phatthalungensis]